MHHSTISLEDRIISLFIFVDDLLKLLPQPRHVGRPSDLSESEIVTFALIQHSAHFTHKKACFLFLSSYCRHLFPGMPAYQNVVRLTNDRSVLAAQLLLLCCAVNRKRKDGYALADSTPLPVCKNKRISSHRVAKDFAKRSKTTTGWFYGFKLHITCDGKGNLLNIALTAGNVDDREKVESLCRNIAGLVIADAGYVSQKLQRKMFGKKIFLFTAVRNNMKKLMTAFQHLLLKKRQRVETVFSVLKERLGLVSSLSRSILGHFSRYLYTCLAYCLGQLALPENQRVLLS